MSRVPLFFLFDFLFTTLCRVAVNWWAPVFASEAGWLPNGLKWVQTFDDTLDAGQRDGIYPPTWPRYLVRVFWLYRNTSYGFAYWALGMRFDRTTWQVREYVPGDATHKQRGFTFYATGPDGAFNWHVVRGPIRFKIGWKAWNLFDPTTQQWKSTPWGPEWRVPFVCSISLAK